jgi:hypothetical protein
MMTPGKPQSFHRFQLQITRKRFAKGRKETIREKSSATQVRTDSKVFYTVFLIFRSIFHSQQISCRNQHKLLKNMPNGLLLTVLKIGSSGAIRMNLFRQFKNAMLPANPGDSSQVGPYSSAKAPIISGIYNVLVKSGM